MDQDELHGEPAAPEESSPEPEHPQVQRTIAIVLSWKRTENLPYVIRGLRRQSYVDDIMIFHNHPSDRRMDGCINVFSDHNFGCAVRHQLALLLDYDYFVFIDDDLMLSRDLAPWLVPQRDKHGERRILGLVGHTLNLANQTAPYSSGSSSVSKTPRAVDLVKGRFHMLSRGAIQAICDAGLHTRALLAEDDIRANVAVQMAFGEPGLLVPAVGVRYLPEPHGRWHRSNHLDDRDQAVQEAMELGWRPLGPRDDRITSE
ncbi:MAG: glycosyltransferase family A protein [Pseudomonadota bacterium]